MRRKGLVIAMDGPAGVGKSTVGGLVAKSLGYKFINTGEMYRALDSANGAPVLLRAFPLETPPRDVERFG